MKKPASPNHSCLRTCVGHCAWGVSRVGSVVRGQVPGPIMSCSTMGWTGPDPICGWNFGRGLVTSCLEQAGLEKTKENRKKNLDLSSEGFPARRVVITSRDDSYHTVKAPVELAWTGEEFNARYKGTRNMPPPRPRPLNIPAPKLCFRINFQFESRISSFYTKAFERLTVSAFYTLKSLRLAE